jgi:hypothetical protein
MMGTVQFSCSVTTDLFVATIIYQISSHWTHFTTKILKIKNFLNPKLGLQAYGCCYSSGHS